MFTVYDKGLFKERNIPREVKVYDIIYDKSGYPLFLIRDKGQWIKRSAKYFLTHEEVYGKNID